VPVTYAQRTHAGRPRPLRATVTLTLGVSLVQYLCNEAYLQQIRYIAWSNARAISKVPLVTFRQRVKDVYYGGVTWLYEATGMERIPDEEYLLEQLVLLDGIKEKEVRAQQELAELEALYATSFPNAPR
jgi:isocitrate dehydrogenase